MSRRGLEFWAACAGIAFVVLFVVGLIVGTDDSGDTDQEIVAHYADESNRTEAFVFLFLVLAGLLVFLFFLGGLRRRLRQAEGEPGGLAAAALAAGAAFAALMMAAVCVWVSVPFAIDDSEQFTLDPDTARLVGALGYALFFSSLTLTAVLVGATSALALRTGVFPRWLGWVGVVVAVAMLASFTFVPFFVFLAWVLVVSVVMILRPATAVAAGEVSRATR